MTKQMFVEGSQVGHLILIKRFRKNKRPYWLCQCDCGNTKEIREDSLKSGRAISCGCRSKATQYKKTKYPLREHPEYQIANGIFQRCYNPKNCNYKNYGAKGIKVNKADFPTKRSLADYILKLRQINNDTEDRKLSVDRIDCYGDYSKKNIRLADRITQNNNTCKTLYVDYCGKTYPLSVICRQLGINNNNVYTRMTRYNLSVQQSFEYYLN